jgi:signal transduction histidine kinase
VRLVNDILDLERMQSGARVMHKVDCDLAEVMVRATDGVRSVADESGVNLRVHPLRWLINVDPDALMQVLTNLLSNAVKFSPAGSRVELTARRISGGCARIEVHDQGRGIPHDQLERIFQRFHQVDASDSRAKGGTGLGLAICRMIVELHGGRIWAESSPGAGSTFVVELPVGSLPDNST